MINHDENDVAKWDAYTKTIDLLKRENEELRHDKKLLPLVDLER